ncbi:hypothetical protein LINPERPRIM_LOCUS26617, partial [Linum perenne]
MEMSKSFALCFFLSFLFLASFGGTKLVVEAKMCVKVSPCDGGRECFDQCKKNYNGVGACSLPTPPYQPVECV